MMNADTYSIAFVAIVFPIFFSSFHVTKASGFSIDLIHRDSLKSPSLDSISTTSNLVRNALERSFHRANYIANKHDSILSISTDIVPDGGEYLMKFSLGTPPIETLAIADTGSDLTWIQCKPCTQCFKQKSPIFDPNRSSTYKPVSCSSNACFSVPGTSCSFAKNTCGYTMSYGDRSISRGDLAEETITLGSEKIPNVMIGCGHFDKGTFGDGTSGIVGLGGGEASLITQMGSLIQGKFSYCLVPSLGQLSKPSKMNFANNALVLGPDVARTPIVQRSPKTFYFLTLEGITIGDQRLLFADPLTKSSSFNNFSNEFQEGNIIIDSGTTLTFLPRQLYYDVITEVQRQVKGREIDDPLSLLDLCYFGSGDDVEVPEIIAHFKGADVKLKTFNSFVKTSETSFCLAFAPASSIAIFGNLAQINFLVGYDLKEGTVSFKPTECAAHKMR